MRAIRSMGLCGCLIWVAATAASSAQSQSPPGPPGGPGSWVSDAPRLPGDNPPPRAMLLQPPPTPGPGSRPPPEPGTDAPGPPLSLALEAVQAALDACKADGYKVGVSVVDSLGQPRAAMSADGARGGHVYTAVRKGLTAVAFSEPTSLVSSQLQTDPSVANRLKPGMMPWAGAVPLTAGGHVIGAIGVSGASSMQDEKCARAGADKIRERLK
jgi:uncharacterized protein GlcG (DUF336 family)